MFEDFLIRYFHEIGEAERFLAFVTLVVVGVGVWLGRRRLSVTIPIALVVLILAAMTIPSAIPARPYAQRNACINNLKMIQRVKTLWASENGKKGSDVPLDSELFGEGRYIDIKIKLQ